MCKVHLAQPVCKGSRDHQGLQGSLVRQGLRAGQAPQDRLDRPEFQDRLAQLEQPVQLVCKVCKVQQVQQELPVPKVYKVLQGRQVHLADLAHKDL